MKSALLMDDDIARELKKNSADIKSLSEKTYVSSSTPQRAQQINQSSIAYRMMVELVVGMVFGIGIGYGLDLLFNTFPIFLVIFSLLGFAAGIRVMLQTANQINIVKDQSEERL